MALNKFEEHIKQQLETREIRPSDSAWEKVAGKLDQEPLQKSTRFRWYGIAASVIFLLAISWFFLSSEKEGLVPDTEIVDTKKDTKREISSPIPLPSDGMKENIDPVVQVDKKPLEKTMVQDTGKLSKAKDPLMGESLKDTLGLVALRNYETSEEDLSQGTKEEMIINAKIAEVVAQVDLLERNRSKVSDEEIDSLLRRAQKELLGERLLGQTGTIDPMSLLADVEDELDQSFRDRVFEKLKIGLSKVRTAVADRDN